MLDAVLHEKLPFLCKDMESQGVPSQTYTMQWMLCLFTTATPSITTVRIWDLLIIGSAPHAKNFSPEDSDDHIFLGDGDADGAVGGGNMGGNIAAPVLVRRLCPLSLKYLMKQPLPRPYYSLLYSHMFVYMR